METIDVIDSIIDGNKAEAIDKINDLLYAKAADALNMYKSVVASSYFDTPEDQEETEESLDSEEDQEQ